MHAVLRNILVVCLLGKLANLTRYVTLLARVNGQAALQSKSVPLRLALGLGQAQTSQTPARAISINLRKF